MKRPFPILLLIALPVAAEITTFAPASPSVCKGKSVVLAWTTTETANAMLSSAKDTFPVPVNGTMTVTPVVDTTYTLTAVDRSGATTWANTTVTVVPEPVLASFTLRPMAASAAGSPVTQTSMTAAPPKQPSRPGASDGSGGSAFIIVLMSPFLFVAGLLVWRRFH